MSIPLGMIMEGANIIGNQLTAQQQYDRQRKLMGLQQQHQMALNEQGREIQMKMWEDTNYPAQIAQLKKAGLNPSLIYAKGGVGGSTGSQT